MEGLGSEERMLVRVIPRARRDEVAGLRGGRVLIRTTAPPVDDKANAAVVRIVAEHLGVSRASVEIVSGHHSRDKELRVRHHAGET